MSYLQKKINNVQTSLGRCLMKSSFLDDFYSVFIESDPLIKEHFKNTDISNQKVALKHGLTYMMMFLQGSIQAKNKISELGKIHSRTGLNIKAKLYNNWINSLLKTVRVHDNNIDNQLFEDWKYVISQGVKKMKAVY